MAAKPKWDINSTIQSGHRTLELAEHHVEALTPRLPSGLIDGLESDLTTVEGKVASSIIAPSVLKSLTADQNAATTNGHAFVVAVREAIVRARATDTQRRAFGVGLPIQRNLVSQVSAGLTAVIDGMTRYPDLSRSAGLLESDLDAARAMLETINATNAVQERGKEVRKLTTAARNAAAVRLEKAIDRVAGVGALTFFAQPEIAKQFRELIPKSRRSRSD
jgi:hypothetical protein